MLFPAARAVGPQGHVVGVDFAEGVGKAAAAEVYAATCPSSPCARWMPSNSTPDASFDACCAASPCSSSRTRIAPWPSSASSSQPAAASPSAPGARTITGGIGSGALIRRYLPPPPAPPDGATKPDFSHPEGLHTFLSQAGFQDIRVVTDEEEHFFESTEDWSGPTAWTHGERMFLETIVETRGEAALEQFKAEAFTQMEAMRQPGGYPERFFAHFTVAPRR